jgi:parallel beta-helix repeat protein
MHLFIPEGLKNDPVSFDDEIMPKASNPSFNLSFIHVDNNWTQTAASYDWCNGSGSWNDPFIIWDVGISTNATIAGIFINNSQDVYFRIQDCIVSNNSTAQYSAGVRLENTTDGRIINVNSSYNTIGLMFYNTHNTSIELSNVMSNDYGIYLCQSSSNNTLYKNNIIDNTIHGVNMTDCEDIIVYYNNFTNNGIHATDSGLNSVWHNGTVGNYWDDYDGKDVNDDGIGDTSYLIDGSAGSLDMYPLWWDSPVISVISPTSYSLYGHTPPNFTVSLIEGVNHSWWYTINSDVTKHHFSTNGSINTGAWGLLSNGSHVLSFYVNDSKGYKDYSSVTVYKDIETPSIDIIYPVNYTVFGNFTCNFTVIILEPNLNSSWYVVNGGTEILFDGTTGQNHGVISQTEWNKQPNGTVVISFFANDSVGNVGIKNVTVYKDIESPTIIIYDPLPNEIFGTDIPECNVTVYDINGVNATWYQLTNGTTTTATRSWTGSIHPDDWNAMVNGTVTLIIFANDTVGNIDTENVSFYKDIIGPDITINEPFPFEMFGVVPPVCNVVFYDINGVNTTWYQLTNGTITTSTREYTGSIHIDDWNAMANGTVTLIFYANDTLGNIASNNIAVYKDIISPYITINKPNPYDVFGTSPPTCDVVFYDINTINYTWYHLTNGTITTNNREWTSFINIDDWNAMPNGTVVIVFFANDTMGNIASENVSVYKDIIGPYIIINEPNINDLFGLTPPSCDIVTSDINGVNTTWYQLSDGITTTAIRVWAGSIHIDDWNTMVNGTVTLMFYANDTLGNIGTASVSIYKDIISPTITINDPLPFEVFGPGAPSCDVIFYDINGIDSSWYQLTDGFTTTPIRTWTGVIDTNDWNTMVNGTVTLIFYANDTLGNIDSANVSVYKDIIPPTIMINDPTPNEVFGTTPPVCDVIFYDINGINSAWYKLTNGTFTTAIRNWTGSIHIDDWNAMANGTVTLVWFANDTLGNIALENVSIYKDIIIPTITINAPLPNEVFGSNSPPCTITFYDINGIDSMWYQLTDETTTTAIRTWTGSIHIDDWNAMANGTVTFIIFANDTVGNVATENVSIYKDIIGPDITINEPLPYELFGNEVPPCDVIFYDVNGVDSTWYQLISGTFTTAIRDWTGSIHVDDWASMANGTVTLVLFANDTVGNIELENVTIYKDIISPFITINDPTLYEVFGTSPPICDVIFYDINIIDYTWYYLTNGTYSTTNREWIGSIHIDDWNAMSNGTVIIVFFANDTVGNIGTENVSVYKDIIGPTITINNPLLYELFGASVPSCDVTFYDINGVDSMWYQLTDGTTTTVVRTWIESIHIDDWNAMANGTVTLILFANDTLGNTDLANVSVYKDIISPIITINQPTQNEVFGNPIPVCDVTFYDINGVDSKWYQLTDETTTTAIRTWTGSIHVEYWNEMANGTVTLIIFANDTVGNFATENVSIYKDIINPTIIINDPLPYELFGASVPSCDLTFYDINGVDEMWYQLTDGTTTTVVRTWIGSIHLDDWNAMPNGTVILIIFANDTVGNIATENVSIYKDIIGPDITINEPNANDVFGTTTPYCDIVVNDINGVNSTWYQLSDGITKTTIRMWTGSIYIDDWNAMPNGNVTFIIFANDTVGNIATENVSIYKDIINPTITINEPLPSEVFGATQPSCDVTFYDINGVDSIWYQLTDGITTTSVWEWTGTIDTNDWDAMSNGTVIIIFYVNDTVSNVANKNVSVYKDIIAPDIIINNPLPYELYGVIPPTCDVEFYDINGVDEMWYQLTDGTTTTAIRTWTGLLHLDDWNAMTNGTITLLFYVNDTVSNLAESNVSIYKDIISPTIIIHEPIPYDVFGVPIPVCDVSFFDVNGVDTTWYQLTDGTTTTTIRMWTGLIHIDDWTLMANGTVTLIFIANDTVNNIASENVSVYRDIIAPTITITDPKPQDVFGLSAPDCTVSFYDINGVDERWYQLTDDKITTAARAWTGLIHIDDWTLMANGTVTLLFYANDTLNNIAIENVTMYKDILSPIITIHDPQVGELFGIPVPTINVSIYDDHLEGVWYQLTNGTITTAVRVWTGFIYQEDWDQIGNGTVTLEFIANDVVNNLAINSVFLRKNIYDPIITIVSPLDNDLFGITPPNITLYSSSADTDTIWYSIYNSTFSTANVTWDGSINVSAWNAFGNGTISIIFYINDTLGNIGFDSVDLRKDMIVPTIVISSPLPFALFGTTQPVISVTYIDDNSISSIRYQLQNFVMSTPLRSWTGSITSSDWNEMSNGTVTIIFRAEDLVGNIAFANVTVRKDIIAPEIVLYYPDNGTIYSHERPWISFYVNEDSGIASASYQLTNGTFSSSILEWNYSIDQELWDQFGNGTITIYIYVNDIIGNNGIASLVVRKDIICPSIVIQSPSQYEEVGRDSPFFEVYITDGNLHTCWYVIQGTNEEIQFTGPFGRINQALWESVWDNTTVNGTITIQFYANDTMGNEHSIDLHVVKYQPTSPVKFEIISNPLGFIFSTIGLVTMFPITFVTIKSRYYQNLNKKEKSKLKKVLIAAFLLLSVAVLFYFF